MAKFSLRQAEYLFRGLKGGLKITRGSSGRPTVHMRRGAGEVFGAESRLGSAVRGAAQATAEGIKAIPGAAKFAGRMMYGPPIIGMASAFTDSPIVRRRAIGAGVGAIAGGAGAEENIRIKRAEGKRYNVAQRAALIGAGAFGGSMVGAWVGGMSTGVAKAAVKTAKRLRKGDFGTTGELATLAGTGTLGAGLSYREEKKKGHGPLSKGMAIVGGGAMGVLGGTVIGPAVTHFGGMAGIKAGKKAKAAYGAGRAAASAKYSNITQAVLRRMKQNRVTPQSKALVKYKGGR